MAGIQEMHCMYIMANRAGTVLYTGKASHLGERVSAHKSKLVPGFTARYNVDRLVYYEAFETWQEARERERQIKAGSRTKKLALINAMNPTWRDLSYEL